MSSHRGTVRPSNRPAAGGEGEDGWDQVDGSLHNIRDEIASLRSQISRGIDSLNTAGRQPADTSARDMEELADYFSQRLANCQRQVYNVVNQVQSHVGDQPTTTNPSQVSSNHLMNE